jgi:single-stranded-DNA-specific exonuclease
MRWQLASADAEKVENLARRMHVPPLIARLLVLRRIEEPETAYRFLNPRLDHLHDPFLMADMAVAVNRLNRAIARQEKIVIYGDYDVDGTMAVVVLLAALESLGARVEVHIPHRLRDGYGMRVPVVENAAAEGFKVLLSVDTGIREHEVLERARELGIDCIVTDHHLPKESLPLACAILNPRRSDCAYPEKNLAGVGVAFKLVQALLGSRMTEALLRSYLKVVAVGTIADVVPLAGENRVIASIGLEALRQPVQPGLSALLETAGVSGRRLSAGDVGFRIAPRLNAAGRMEDARAVIDLFTTTDPLKARQIAQHLENLNSERQQTEESILRAIDDTMRSDPTIGEGYTLVFAGEGWHRGVLGIVAQRVAERCHRPTLVVGTSDGVAHGSGRSISGFHLMNALTASQDLFERFGGHASAAGFAMPSNRVGELKTKFERYARSVLTPEQLDPVLPVDAEMELDQVDWPLYEKLMLFQPFGLGNPTPVFAVRNLQLLLPPRIMGKKHLKLRVGKDSKVFDALGWRKGEEAGFLKPGDRLDLAFTLDENFYQGTASLQMVLKDIHPRR